jgi:hypothetical protein
METKSDFLTCETDTEGERDWEMDLRVDGPNVRSEVRVEVRDDENWWDSKEVKNDR